MLLLPITIYLYLRCGSTRTRPQNIHVMHNCIYDYICRRPFIIDKRSGENVRSRRRAGHSLYSRLDKQKISSRHRESSSFPSAVTDNEAAAAMEGIEKLDEIFGTGQGAGKARAKLQAILLAWCESGNATKHVGPAKWHSGNSGEAAAEDDRASATLTLSSGTRCAYMCLLLNK